jgi:antitoxin (DNA-binding transcriptional repressor) of toxin-antitoxin stability system
MDITITGAGEPWAEVVHHKACRTCGNPYEDNSRASKDCPTCRADPKVRKAQRLAKYHARKARGLK